MNRKDDKPRVQKGPRSYTDRQEDYVSARIDRLSPANQRLAERVVAGCRRRQNKPATILRYLNVVGYANDMFPHRSLLEMTAEDWRQFIDHRISVGAPSSAYGDSIAARTILRHLLGGELPSELDQATFMKDPGPPQTSHILDEAEFRALLEASRGFKDRYPRSYACEMLQALLWIYWDTGFRAREALNLTIGDVNLHPDGGAYLSIRYGPGIKTKNSVRTVYVLDSAKPLRVWLDVHPDPHNRNAPLWYGFRSDAAAKRLRYKSFQKIFIRLATAAGLGAQDLPTGNLRIHDFRHTCATRKAKLGWNEAQLRAYFGWSPTSKMPGRYVRLALEDMRDLVRQNAGVDDHGYATAVEVGDDAAALAALLSRIMNQQRPTNRPAVPVRNK